MKYIAGAFLAAVIAWFGGSIFAQYSLEDAAKVTNLTGTPKYLVGTDIDPTGTAKDATTFGQRLVRGLVGILTMLAVFFIVYTGLNWVTSAGNSDGVEKGKTSLKWIILGLLLVIFAYVIVKTVITLPYSGSV